MDCNNFNVKYKFCLQQGHLWAEAVNGIKQCVRCRSYTNSINFLDELFSSSKRTIDNLQKVPFHKKIFNYIKNDLRGILNSFNDDSILTEHSIFYEDLNNLKAICSVFKSNLFHEERYNKRKLKDDLVEYIRNSMDNNLFQQGNKTEGFFDIFPLNDRELILLVYIINNYD